MSEERQEEPGVPLRWCIPPGLVSRFATNMVVQHTEQEFIISFFEARPPLLIGSEEEVRAQLAQIGGVEAECVARIIVTADRMPGFVAVLQETLRRYQARFQGES